MEAPSEKKSKNMFAAVCITQAICIAVILITVLIIKIFFKPGWQKLRHWCVDNVLEKTEISDVFNKELDG